MKKISSAISQKIREWLSLDYRSLAVLRIGIGIILILDLIQRAEDLSVFYGDNGVLPRSELLRLWDNQWWVSLHMASGLASFEAILFVIAGIFAVMLTVGYRTRLAMIMSWFFLVSIHVRNPMILQGADIILRAIMFWMMFLPLGKVWSLDRLFNRIPRPSKKTILSAATIAFILQVCLLYIFTGLLKTGTAWHDGTAVYYALQLDQLVTPLGVMMREFPHVLYYLTFITWYVELYGTILFFSPVYTGFFRTLGIFVFACLQIGFNSTMRLGLFGTIAIVITLGLLPTSFWDEGFAWFTGWIEKKSKTGLTIYYDYECSFCYKVSFVIKRFLLLHPDTKILPAHTNPEVEKIMLEKNSWVIVDEQYVPHTSFDGVITVVKYSLLFFWLTPLLRIKPIRSFGEGLYILVSKSRKQVCIPEPEEPALTKTVRSQNILISLILSVLMIYVVAWNIDTLDLSTRKIITPQIESIGWFLHLDQKFNMFAPTPLTEDGWYVYPGTLRDGTSVDVFDGASPVSYTKPDWIAYRYPNQRWQKYLMNLWSKDFSEYRLGYGKYLCRTWNATHPANKQLMSFDMVFMLKNTPPPGVTPGPIVPTTIWNHHCF